MTERPPNSKWSPWWLLALFFIPWFAAALFYVGQFIAVRNSSPTPNPDAGQIFGVAVGNRYIARTVYVDFHDAVTYWATMAPLEVIVVASILWTAWLLVRRRIHKS